MNEWIILNKNCEGRCYMRQSDLGKSENSSIISLANTKGRRLAWACPKKKVSLSAKAGRHGALFIKCFSTVCAIIISLFNLQMKSWKQGQLGVEFFLNFINDVHSFCRSAGDTSVFGGEKSSSSRTLDSCYHPRDIGKSTDLSFSLNK